MRRFAYPLAAAIAAVAALPALAQQTYPPSAFPPPPVPGTPPSGPAYIAPPLTGTAGADTTAGARPGNVIGTGQSLPSSDRASNISPTDTRSTIAPNLPSPGLGTGASPRAYLVAARNALVAGRTGEAQQSLEMAQTRLLDRSVPLFQTNTPDRSPAVEQISAALQALGMHDRARAMQIIETTIPQVAENGTP